MIALIQVLLILTRGILSRPFPQKAKSCIVIKDNGSNSLNFARATIRHRTAYRACDCHLGGAGVDSA